MILDNSTEEKKVINWLRKETPTDIKFNIVTGYFTIGALYDFFQLSNEKINELNIVIGDLTLDDAKDYPIDLLNGNVSLAGAFQMPVKAKAVVEFLKDVKVNIH